ncbi:sigma-70 family RNA polymerase sigma factor [Bordetella trematum]|uniref:sigma-70 family RNA polymerase sigma factor n=1 Tax=Bordetella trematum TaxID=123899 RepID=UPI000D8E90F8|nr:sigma-70 family RNA polymerase sigma factor [Bordetella trematum]SPU48884.1 heme uptake RNA polymerase sigma-70 factor [Bordetella trematum]VDH04610.1 Probable RNA polymerase sigma factor fecI [Bordetella trematum]
MLVPDQRSSLEIEALYSAHHGWLHNWLRGRLGNSFDAADLAQDTFVKLLANDEILSIREPRALLTTIARRVVANFYRRRRIEEAYLATLALLPEPEVPGPETRALLLETLLEIDKRLSQLKIAARRAFLMHQVEGMTQVEIAQALNVSVATVQRYLERAVHRVCFG